MKKHTHSRDWIAIGAWTAHLVLHSGPAARAEEATASPTPTSTEKVTIEEFDSICGEVVKLEKGECKSVIVTNQDGSTYDMANDYRFQYCQTACMAKKTSKDETILAFTWGGVFAVCTTACVASFTGAGAPAGKFICAGSQIAAAGAEAVIAKDLARMMTGSITAVGGLMVSGGTDGVREAAAKGGESAATEGAKQGGKGDIATCLSAAVAGVQSGIKVFNSIKQKEMAEEALASAKTAESPATAVNTNLVSAATSGGGGDLTTASNGLTPGTASGVGTAESSGSCFDNSTSAMGTVACSAALDKNLPSWVRSPGFQNEFEKSTGIPLGSYLASESPEKALPATLGGLPSSTAAAIAQALDKTQEQLLASNVDGASYRGGGGRGSSGGGGDSGPDLSQMMAGFMDQLNPNGKKKDAGPGTHIAFGPNGQRYPAGRGLPEQANLFERVSVRYQIVTPRIIGK